MQVKKFKNKALIIIFKLILLCFTSYNILNLFAYKGCLILQWWFLLLNKKKHAISEQIHKY